MASDNWCSLLSETLGISKEETKVRYLDSLIKLACSPTVVMQHVDIEWDSNLEHITLIPTLCIALILKGSDQFRPFYDMFGSDTIFFVRNSRSMNYITFFQTYKDKFDDKEHSVKVSFLANITNTDGVPIPIHSRVMYQIHPLNPYPMLTYDDILNYDVLTLFMNKHINITPYYSAINRSIEMKKALIPKILDKYQTFMKGTNVIITNYIDIFKKSFFPDFSDHTSSSKTDCVICYEKSAQYMDKTCRHLCLCITCSEKVVICPICRNSITEIVQVFTTY